MDIKQFGGFLHNLVARPAFPKRQGVLGVSQYREHAHISTLEGIGGCLVSSAHTHQQEAYCLRIRERRF